MDRRAKVELFEQIRCEYEHDGGTIRGIAKKLGIPRPRKDRSTEIIEVEE